MPTERELASRMAEAAATWLDSLTPEQHGKATFAFDDEAERTSWAYFPRSHQGLPLLEQTVRQQKLVHVLVATSLSLAAYGQANTIIGLESTLNEIEQRRGDAVRDPGRYFLSIFGSPDDRIWAWRLEGHHVALNFTIASDEVISSTPLFLGANPAEVRLGDRPVVRPCGPEEDAAREVLLSLDADQRRMAVLHEKAPPDIVLSNAPQIPYSCQPGELAPALFNRFFETMAKDQRAALAFDLDGPRGVAAEALDGAQRKLLSELVDIYVGRLPEVLALRERGKINIGRVHFAWAGEDKPRRPHYYRLQGPAFVVEYDNTQDEANHVHAVWRNPAKDFGFDALRIHVVADH